MSATFPALQAHAQAVSDTFYGRYIKPPKGNRRYAGTHTHFDNTPSSPRPAPVKSYRPRDASESLKRGSV